MYLRRIITICLVAAIVGLYTVKGQVARDLPVVIWVSSPVQPGETVLIHGGNFGEKPVVELTCDMKKLTVTPVSFSEASIMFIYPESWKPGIVSGVIKSGELVSKPFQINAPDAWWIHGDRGREASTRLGNVRLFGNCLAEAEKPAPQVSLRNVGTGKHGKSIPLKILKYNRFSVQSANWDEIPAGLYEVILVRTPNNQPVSVGKIRVSEKKNEVPKEVFNVVEFGAIPNDGIDDTQAILAAVQKLKENGGGVLFFPRGRFQMNKTIELPPFSVLRGLGADLSQIYWPDTFEPLDALIKGTHSFEVSDIFLTCGNHKDGIAGNWPDKSQLLDIEDKASKKFGNITIRNVTLRMLYSEYVNDNLDEAKRRLPPLHMVRALRLAGENINVTGNDIYCVAGGTFEFRAYWSNISGNRFCRGNVIGWCGISGQQLIFADNYLGGANTTSFYAPPEGSENVYWGNNYQENTFDGNNREALSGDNRNFVYADNVENITPATFTLKGEVKWNRGVDAWKKSAIQISAGKGVGQIRRIKSIDGQKIELESPWDITPNEMSVINISTFRRRFIYTENKVNDSSISWQSWGSMLEAIIANNENSRTGGYNAITINGESNWFIQFMNNTIETGNSYRGPLNEVPAIDAHIGLMSSETESGENRYPTVRSCVIRNNELKSDTRLEVSGWVVDCVLEKNKISNADLGVTVSAAARNIVLSKNLFQGVYKPYQYNPQSVVIRPAEELWSAMDGVSALMGWQSQKDIPSEWLKTTANKQLINATPEQVSQAWEKTVKAFAKQNAGRPVSDKVVETLLGVQIQTPNWQTINSTLRDVSAGTGSLLISVPNSQVKAHLKLSVRPEDFPFEGWSFEIPEFNLEPGKDTDLNIRITKPVGKARMLRIPLYGELSGDGWKLNFTTTIADSQDAITLDQFKVSQPLDNPLGKQRSLGYIKYENIPKISKEQLVEGQTESGRFVFDSLYTNPASEGKVIYATTTLMAKSPVTVRFQYSQNCLFFVNGKTVGTTLGRGQWGFARFEKGENLVEMLMLPSKGNRWRIGLPQITWVEKTMAIDE